MLEIRNLRKRYGGRIVLDGAALTVEKGEAVALVGANGSGKTTTLRCIVGLHHMDEGEVRVDGVDAFANARGARARLSYLPQRADFPATLTVREILQVVARLRELPDASVERELSLCGLASLASRTVSKLSGGERQRVAVAMMLMPEVNLYLLDEPIASLDASGTRLLVDRICALRDAGRAVLFTTHVTDDLDRLASRVAVLHGGRILPLDRGAASHIVVDFAEDATCGTRVALDLGAEQAWAEGRRLHFLATVETATLILAGLQDRGHNVQAFHSERPLAAALDCIHREENRATALADASGGVVSRLWGNREWPGAAAARSR